MVPGIIPSISNFPPESMDLSRGLDSMLRINTLQILIDRCTTLEHLLLVGHAEKDYIGNTTQLRMWLSNLCTSLGDADHKVRLELVTAIRRYEGSDDQVGPSRTRVHPCEVSAWMMSRAQKGLHWFETQPHDARLGKEELDYFVETFEFLDRTPSTTAATSAMMSRTGSNSTPARQLGAQQQQRVNQAIEAVDMLSDQDSDDQV